MLLIHHVARTPLPGIHTRLRDVADFDEHLVAQRPMFLHTAFPDMLCCHACRRCCCT